MSQHLKNVLSLLEQVHGHAYFKIGEGALKEDLTRVILETAEGDLASTLSRSSFNLEASVAHPEADAEAVIGFSVDYPGGPYRSEAPLARLSNAALDELAGCLERLGEPVAADAPAPSKVIVRKKEEEHDHHDKESAAARLKVSPQWLKSVIPCTEYSYDEIDGRKYIRDYFWSRDLIERLLKIKTAKATPEDLQFVAKECCDGDVDWARELIARLKSPNRPEAASKEQPQKGQQKGGAVQAQQAKPVAPGERPRSRNRNRKFRGNRGKGEAPAAPKPPQG